MRNDDDALGRALARWVGFSLRHGAMVVALSLSLSVLAGFASYRWLGFNVDPNDLFSDDLRFQRMIRSFEAHFPQLTDSLLIVVEGEAPEEVRSASDELAARLRERPDAFRTVYSPGEEAFFESHGLLYQSVEDVEVLTEQLATLQPVLAALSHEPTLATLAWVVRTGLEQAPRDEAGNERMRAILDHFGRAAVSIYSDYPVYVSWESVLLGGTAFDPSKRRVLVADPVLDFDKILAAARPIEVIRESTAGLARTPHSLRVRITGYPALNHEEFLGLARDTSAAGVLSFLLVLAVLWVAFRSAAVVGAAAVTLVCGFLWTAAYASLSVGELNPASIAFAVLFIGLGVDFMIHLGMHFTEEVRGGADVPHALDRATRDTGSALVLCALTTAIGFLAFLPTDYKGVSELGVISAGGMLIIVFLTLTLFPVLIAWTVRGRALQLLRSRSPVRIPVAPARRPAAVVGVAIALGIVGVAIAPRAVIETNVIALRNPETESVQTFMDLLRSDRITPWYIDILAPDLAAAQALAEQARGLPEVRRAATVSDYVPADQDEKLALLGDAAFFMDLPSEPTGRSQASFEEQRDAVRDLVAFLGADSLSERSGGLARSGRLLRDQLAQLLTRIEADPSPEAALDILDESLLGSIPILVERLRVNLETPAVAFEDLPEGLVRRMLADDGVARVQVFPAEDLGDREAMVRFVEALRSVSADITGLPVNLVESSYATRDSLLEALLWALAVIALLLVLLWGRPIEAAVALLPLVLAVLLTLGATWLLGISFNFVNVCVLPLVLGIGVDSGVHMVHRARTVAVGKGALLSSTTAQAVCYSALTTLASFGTLVLSSHRGIGSLGTLLVVGMVFTLLGNLVLLPSLLQLRQRNGRRATASRETP